MVDDRLAVMAQTHRKYIQIAMILTAARVVFSLQQAGNI
jgi:hypothetical protein